MLTAKQERFAQCIALEGMTKSDAYREAYDTDNMSDKTINEKACVISSQDKIKARIEELRKEVASSKIMTAQERMEWLTELIRSNREKTRDKLTAADIMNKMQGEYVQKVEADVKSKVDINIALSDD